MPVYFNGSQQIWYNWNTSATTAGSQRVWASWNNATTSTTLTWNGYNDRVIHALNEDRKWKEAEARADELLHELLDDQQWASWLREHHFHVTGSEGGKYLIKKGHAGNVKQLNDRGQTIASLCIHPRMQTEEGRLPEADAVISQLLTLRTDEADFRRVANITQYAA